MKNTIVSNRAAQPQQRKRITNSFTIIPHSIDRHKLTAGAERTYRRMKRLIELAPNGALDWAVGRIIAFLGIAKGTYQDHRREIERAGLWVIERRRRHGCRMNESNIIRLAAPIKEIVEGGSKIQTQVKNLNTNTNTPRERGPSYAQVRWEYNQKRNHPPIIRKLWDEIQRWREKFRRLDSSQRWTTEANVGYGVRPAGYYAGTAY